MTGRGSAFDFASFKRAYEHQNLDDWVSFYADDAEWIEYRDYSPPRFPNRMVGKRQIAGFPREIYEADLDLTIADEVISMDRIAFSVDCAFPDSRYVFEHVIAHLRDGRIVCQVDMEAWDEE